MTLRLASERGYTLVEMLVVLLIFGTVMSALMALFVQGTSAELDMNKRFQAQQEARVALDRLRRDVHCASAVALGTASSSFVTLTVPCVAGQTVTWCTLGSGQRFGLYRALGTSCTSTAGPRYADHLTTGAVFSQQVQSTTSLWRLHVDLPVNVAPAKSVASYELVDDLVLRNSTRTCTTGSPSPPC
jgi:prepilin-type N-terminal cleavage/methylation domain-containing protein